MLQAPAPQVLVSILNWNKADSTERCVQHLVASGLAGRADVEIRVTDNGSAHGEAERLAAFCREVGVGFSANADNLGFAGGHNALFREAVSRDVPFVWLLNNDAFIEPGTLEALEAEMVADPRCAAASPCLGFEDTRRVYFAGAVHDWPALVSKWCPAPWDEAFHAANVERLWLVGTAVLFRTAAIREVGPLKEELFAYAEDDELSARLHAAGWRSRACREIVCWHGLEADANIRRPPYFYYLMARNLFWFFNAWTPAPHRRLIRLRLASRDIHRAARLREAGYPEQADALLRGLVDGLAGRLGPPDLQRPLPLWFRAAATLLSGLNRLDHLVRRPPQAQPQ